MRVSRKDRQLLNAYLDRELRPVEREALEKRLTSEPALQAYLKALQENQVLLSQAAKDSTLEPAHLFESTLLHNIRQQVSPPGGSPQATLFDKLKYPAVAAIAIFAILYVSFLNESNSTQVSGFSLTGGINPFQKQLSKEDVFNFALYNRLPLDARDNSFIVLGTDGENEFVTVQGNGTLDDQPLTLNGYYQLMGLNMDQVRKFDSILGLYGAILCRQTVMQSRNSLAVNTNIWQLNHNLTADLMTLSSACRKDKLGQRPFLAKNAKYPFRKAHISGNEPYLILPLDTLMERPFNVSFGWTDQHFDSITRQLQDFKLQLRQDLRKMEDSMRLVLVNDTLADPTNRLKAKDGMRFNFTIEGDEASINRLLDSITYLLTAERDLNDSIALADKGAKPVKKQKKDTSMQSAYYLPLIYSLRQLEALQEENLKLKGDMESLKAQMTELKLEMRKTASR